MLWILYHPETTRFPICVAGTPPVNTMRPVTVHHLYCFDLEQYWQHAHTSTMYSVRVRDRRIKKSRNTSELCLTEMEGVACGSQQTPQQYISGNGQCSRPGELKRLERGFLGASGPHGAPQAIWIGLWFLLCASFLLRAWRGGRHSFYISEACVDFKR